MLSCEPLWKTLQEKGESTYTLRYKAGIGGGTLERLKKNDTVSSHTFDMICQYLHCRIEDIVVFVED